MKLFKSLYKVVACLALLLVLTNEFIDANNRSNQARRRRGSQTVTGQGQARARRRSTGGQRRRALMRSENLAQFNQPAAQQAVLQPEAFALPELYIPLPELQPVTIDQAQEPERLEESAVEESAVEESAVGENPYFSMVTIYLNRLHAPYVLGKVFKTTYDDVFACISEILKNYNPATMGIKESFKPWPGGSDIQGAVRFVTELVSKVVQLGDYVKNVRMLDQDTQRELNILVQETQKKYQAVLAECKDFAVAYSRYLKETEFEVKSLSTILKQSRSSKVSVYDAFVKLYKNLAQSYVTFISYFYGTDASIKKHVQQYSSQSIDQVLRILDDQKNAETLARFKKSFQEPLPDSFFSQKDMAMLEGLPLKNAWIALDKLLIAIQKNSNADDLENFFNAAETEWRCSQKGCDVVLRGIQNGLSKIVFYVKQENVEGDVFLQMRIINQLLFFVVQMRMGLGKDKIETFDHYRAIINDAVVNIVREKARDIRSYYVFPIDLLISMATGDLAVKYKQNFQPMMRTLMLMNSCMYTMLHYEDLVGKSAGASVVSCWRDTKQFANETLKSVSFNELITFLEKSSGFYVGRADQKSRSEAITLLYLAMPWFEEISNNVIKTFKSTEIADAFLNAQRTFIVPMIQKITESDQMQGDMIWKKNRVDIIPTLYMFALDEDDKKYWNNLSKDLQNFYKVAAKKGDEITTLATKEDPLNLKVYLAEYASAWEEKITKAPKDTSRLNKAKKALIELAQVLQSYSDIQSRNFDEKSQVQSRIAQNAVRAVANIYVQLVVNFER